MNEMQQIEKQIDRVDAKVSSILVLLKGNEYDVEDKGMIGIQNDHERRIARLERLTDRGKFFILGLTLPAGWGVADMVYKLFFK